MDKVSIYIFKHAPEIYADASGKFFRFEDHKQIKITFHHGRIVVRNRKKFYGIKRLRKNALKTTTEFLIPF